MLPDEVHDIGVIANEFWEKAREYEIVLLKKQIPSLDFEAVKAVLEAARLASKYSTLPLQDINSRLISLKNRNSTGTNYIDCWALNYDTGKYLSSAVLARSPEGAREQFIKDLLESNVIPVEYDLYIGEESFDKFFHDRFEIACRLNPKIRESADRLKKIGLDGIVKSITKSLPKLPDKKYINTGVRVKEMTDAAMNIKEEYDPLIPDDCPF